jgi:hypothetical protein
MIMKVYVVHESHGERYDEGQHYSKVYYVASTPEKAAAVRAELCRKGGPSFASITEMEIDKPL